MRTHIHLAAAAALATVIAAPAAAQVNGIGVADPAVVVAGSQALRGAYTAIGTQYQAQRTQLEQLDQQRTALLKKLDTNNDGQLSQAEQQAATSPNNPTGKQLQTLEQQIAQVQGPINLARAYAVEQVAQQLNPSVQQVVSQGNIQMILAPNQVLYMADAVDVTDKITKAINARLPQVSTTPPANWQPTQQTVQLYQEVQQILVMAAAQQQANAAQQQPAAQPGKAPAAPVKGR